MIEAIQYVAYDMSISDLQERKTKAIVYISARKLQDAIGIGANKVPLYTNPQDQKRFFSKKLNKYFAIRLASKEQMIAVGVKSNFKKLKKQSANKKT